MKLRKYKPDDCEKIALLFYETVHTVNAKDYLPSQLAVWATGQVDLSGWNKSFLDHDTAIAEENGKIIGFGDMDDCGYLDRLYVHKDYQNMGTASSILTQLEQNANMKGIFRFTTHASITAKPFFEKHGYIIVKENIVTRRGIELTNFIMEKTVRK